MVLIFVVALAAATSIGFATISNVIQKIEALTSKSSHNIAMTFQITLKFARILGDPINDPKPN